MQSGGGGRIHAFEFSELGGLCRTLRQVCLGLVELAYPESRPTPTTQYKDAVGGGQIELGGGKNQTPAWSHLFKVSLVFLRAVIPYEYCRSLVIVERNSSMNFL